MRHQDQPWIQRQGPGYFAPPKGHKRAAWQASWHALPGYRAHYLSKPTFQALYAVGFDHISNLAYCATLSRRVPLDAEAAKHNASGVRFMFIWLRPGNQKSSNCN